MPIKSKIIIQFLFLNFLGNLLFAQDYSEGKSEIKIEINELLQENDVIKINDILNKNNFLEPKYTFEIITLNMKYAKEKGTPKELADTYKTSGNFWHIQGNKSKAYENYLQCESISRKNHDMERLGTCLRNRATLMTDVNERIEVLKEAISTFEKTTDKYSLIVSHMNLGVAYSSFVKQEQPNTNQPKQEVSEYKAKAFKHFHIADSLNINLLQNIEISAALNTYYGEWFLYEGNLTKAREAYTKSKDLLWKHQNIKGYVNSLLELARIDMDETQYKDALSLLDEAENLSKKFEFNDKLVQIYNEYSILYDSVNNKDKTLEYFRLYANQALSLSKTNSEDKIQIVSLEHNLAERELLLKQYETQTKLNQTLIILIILITTSVLIVLYYNIQNKKRKIDSIEKGKVITELEKSAVEIKLKNQILEDELLKEKVKYSQNHLMLFANQVNKIDTFLSTLKSEMKDAIPEKQDKINSLKISFSEVLNNQNELKQLNSLSSQLNQEFFFYIRQNYNSVTREDEQLLSYIILDMSIKEISHNLNISLEGVYKKRYRLKKKLNLVSEGSFISFYEKITQKLKSNTN